MPDVLVTVRKIHSALICWEGLKLTCLIRFRNRKAEISSEMAYGETLSVCIMSNQQVSEMAPHRLEKALDNEKNVTWVVSIVGPQKHRGGLREISLKSKRLRVQTSAIRGMDLSIVTPSR